MIPAAILLFLVGAVLAWGFRVWILVPITLLATTAAAVVQVAMDAGIWTACGYSLLIGLMPQLGYAFGLFARSALSHPPAPLSSRGSSVTTLFKRRSFNQTR